MEHAQPCVAKLLTCEVHLGFAGNDIGREVGNLYARNVVQAAVDLHGRCLDLRGQIVLWNQVGGGPIGEDLMGMALALARRWQALLFAPSHHPHCP